MIPIYESLIRLALAALLGSVIGLERQRREWAAGLRTHMLVCVGSALAMIVSAYGFGDVVGKPGVVLDPSRVAAQVISGIGFLGVGTILFIKDDVDGTVIVQDPNTAEIPSMPYAVIKEDHPKGIYSTKGIEEKISEVTQIRVKSNYQTG